MSGPPPKHSSTRRRRTKPPMAVRTLMEAVPDSGYIDPFPPLPEGRSTWHPLTLAHWRAVMDSPMRAEYTASDIQGLYKLAVLWDDFAVADNYSLRVKISSEIRQQEARFGLSPIDRRRLQWEISRGEEAEERTQRTVARKESRQASPESVGSDDPRDLLMG